MALVQKLLQDIVTRRWVGGLEKRTNICDVIFECFPVLCDFNFTILHIVDQHISMHGALQSLFAFKLYIQVTLLLPQISYIKLITQDLLNNPKLSYTIAYHEYTDSDETNEQFYDSCIYIHVSNGLVIKQFIRDQHIIPFVYNHMHFLNIITNKYRPLLKLYYAQLKVLTVIQTPVRQWPPNVCYTYGTSKTLSIPQVG